MSKLTDFFWPTLERPTPAEVDEDEKSEVTDIAGARSGAWSPSPELALEEARRLADSEEDRRRTTEAKASTYLLFAAAFAAVLIPFLPGILEGKTGSAPRWLVAGILIVAAVYLIAAGVWAFRALRVGIYHRLDVSDLVQIWRNSNPTRSLIRQTLVISRRNYRAVNEKVSCIKLVDALMVRSFVAFGILIVVEAGSEVSHSISLAESNNVGVHTNAYTKVVESGAHLSPAASASTANPPPSGVLPNSNRTATGTTATSIKQPPAMSDLRVGKARAGTNTSKTGGVSGPTPSSDDASKRITAKKQRRSGNRCGLGSARQLTKSGVYPLPP